MTQLKTVIWPDAPPAKPESDELTFAAKGRAAEIMAGTRTGTASRMVLSAKATANGCSPKPSNQDRPPLFRELHALNPQQHVARS